MNERAQLIAFIRGEVVGPAAPLFEPTLIQFAGRSFTDSVPRRRGAVVWQPQDSGSLEEVLYFNSEPPSRKYGIGILHPLGAGSLTESEQAAKLTDTGSGVETAGVEDVSVDAEEEPVRAIASASMMEMPDDDFEVASPDVRRPSTMGLSFCADLPESASVVIRLPRLRKFTWQSASDHPIPVNGRYETCEWVVAPDGAAPRKGRAWRRQAAVPTSAEVRFSRADVSELKPLSAVVPMAEGCPLSLTVDLYARRLKAYPERFLITVVLRNRTVTDRGTRTAEGMLFQSYFQVHAEGGALTPYPESSRPFGELDDDEQSLALLYQESAVWGIGHGCAAGWDSEPGKSPDFVYIDVMPGVETPNMTPDIVAEDGTALQLRMREMATLSDDGTGSGWESFGRLTDEYRSWITRMRESAEALRPELGRVATRHMDACEQCLARIERGIDILRVDPLSRRAFRLANRGMLLQQIATKVLARRGLAWDAREKRAKPTGATRSPVDVFRESAEGETIGVWRAFQAAFLLMQVDGMSNSCSPDREVVDLIWFPTGGGKTEAYLAVAAFHMFHQRLLMEHEGTSDRDGTNVLMRYTLRMLTTQQFQRAASLICSMEYLRRHPESHDEGRIAGERFGLGLWIGSEGSPKDERGAQAAVTAFEKGEGEGNPLVLTECPWCRSEIGGIRKRGAGSKRAIAGITPNGSLLCPDAGCAFGRRSPTDWLPVEVVDTRIYQSRPSMIIATADKFALLAYRPKAGSIFGRELQGNGVVCQKKRPPAVVIQDELHLIAGPLGTIYGLYEGVIEALCSQEIDGKWTKPKIIASTATIRGASAQTKSLYARLLPDGTANVQLFPSPGITMGDSFFGRYDRASDGRLSPGRLYLGIHANEFGSILTTQVRVFAAALAMVPQMPLDKQDAWWTLLAFYNSLRELGGAKTLFDSDIRSRLKFIQNREAVADTARRTLRPAEELTSRLSQAEIVGMMDKLAIARKEPGSQAVDACLASSIIEVGVDIDRLSLLGVIGQPKTTAQYIQVTGRVGRRWKDRPGLVLTLYSPSKSRDRSHFEQFHSYHRRLYERVEPTSATPFATSAIQRALAGALLTWARQQTWSTSTPELSAHSEALDEAKGFLVERCRAVQSDAEAQRSVAEIESVHAALVRAMRTGRDRWENFPPSPDEDYLLLWPGQYYTLLQKQRGVQVPSSMRQVDSGSEFRITDMYALEHPQGDEV